MKKIIFYTKFLSVISVVVLLLGACSTSTKVISSWTPPSVPPGTMQKVLVLAVMNNRENVDAIENTMANELNNAGIMANTATSVFGPRGFTGLTEEQVSENLRGSAYTAVMIVSLQEREQELNHTPGTVSSSPRVVGYSRYYRRYMVVNDRIYNPGYYTSSTNYILQADIFTVNNSDELIYSAQTRSFDPNSASDLAQSFSKSIINELNEKGIIANR